MNKLKFDIENIILKYWKLLICRRYGTKCSGCGQGIAPSDLVRKPRDKVFHLNCFTCCICRKQLSTGEQLYVLDDNKFICKDDYLLGKGPGHHHHHSMTGKCNHLNSLKLYVELLEKGKNL